MIAYWRELITQLIEDGLGLGIGIGIGIGGEKEEEVDDDGFFD